MTWIDSNNGQRYMAILAMLLVVLLALVVF